VTLKLDLDALHESPLIPNIKPSTANQRQLVKNLDLSEFSTMDFYQTNSPYQTFEKLSSTALTDSQKWDVVAYIWQSNTTSEALANGKKLFAQNCAACHGENGNGDGIFADDLKAAGDASKQTMTGSEAMKMQSPANFTDPERILGANPALLQGKILRGGMGTGMPMWGSIFTADQIWDLVAYLYSFQFEYH
jgi:mono/diheme cytochrome c family protein